MPAGLSALGDNDVRAGVKRLPGLVERLYLRGERNAGVMDPVGERPQLTE